MPTKKQILDAASAYANAEANLADSRDFTERRESLFAAFTAWDNLEKLIEEATEGPF